MLGAQMLAMCKTIAALARTLLATRADQQLSIFELSAVVKHAAKGLTRATLLPRFVHPAA